ncbi:MAG: hypothetical protein HY261_05825 [Chloroflexi bacterium]|nr:hypothetical protein [Chloroflexota bacterium]
MSAKKSKQSKNEYVKHRERVLKEKQAVLAAMRKKAAPEHHGALQRVEQLAERAGRELGNLVGAIEDDLGDVRAGVDKAFGDLEAAFYELSSKIRLP